MMCLDHIFLLEMAGSNKQHAGREQLPLVIAELLLR